MAFLRELQRPWRSARRQLLWLWHRMHLPIRCACNSAHYRTYLHWQMQRTLLKMEGGSSFAGQEFIAQIVEQIGTLRGRRVLCVGCRTGVELECFRDLGAEHVVGIDLVSTSPDILVMDMHCLTFPDSSFDLVFASHSLEHALYPRQVAGEFSRVVRPGGWIAIEVPVLFPVSQTDLQDYRDADGLAALFPSAGRTVIWSRRLKPYEADSRHGTPVVRLVLQRLPLEQADENLSGVSSPAAA